MALPDGTFVNAPLTLSQITPRQILKMSLTVGFIGLGAIGYPMAAAICKQLPKDSKLHIFDVSDLSVQRFQQEFATIRTITIGNSPRQIAAEADVVVSMVPGSPQVLQVYTDSIEGIIAAPPNPQRLLLECSTIDAATARSVSRELQRSSRGIYVDAPVSGGVPAAERGSLSFMIGHSEPQAGDEVGQQILKILTMMGDVNKLFWCGGVGSGLAAKISNNYISCSVLLLVAEAMAIGVKSGVDPKMLHKIIQNSTGQTFMGDNVCPVPGVVSHAPSSNNWKLGFKTQMFLKDLSLGIHAARREGIEPTLAEAAYAVFARASEDERCIDRDGSSVYLYITNSGHPEKEESRA